jgi:DNA-binding transcriptional MerR regulator
METTTAMPEGGLTREEVDSQIPAAAILGAYDPGDPRFETVEDPRIPPDQMYFKIGEIARLTGIKAYVLRYWEAQFPFLRPEKTSSKQRRYRRIDFAMLLKIARLRYEEQLTIDRTRKIIREDMKVATAARPKKRRSVEDKPMIVASEGMQRTLAEMRKMVLELLEAVEE